MGHTQKKYQIDTPENREFLKAGVEDLLRFGRRFPSPEGGSYYHSEDHCSNGKGITFTSFRYAQLDEEPYSKLKPCPNCTPLRRLAEIREVNELYAPGGDHEELLNSLRQDYLDYLEE